jgi:hypothetical protein
MRNFIRTIVSLIMIMGVLTSCSSSSRDYRGYTLTRMQGQDGVIAYESENNQIEMYFSDSTIIINGERYSFTYQGLEEDNYNVSITYPDGYKAWWQQIGSSGSGDNLLGTENRLDFDLLTAAIQFHEHTPKAGSGKLVQSRFIMIILALFGLFPLLAPEISWYLSYGWRFKNAEPSDAAIVMQRIGGGAIIVISLLVFISSFN